MIDLGLLNKYNVPVPRYTSYPTVPFWKDSIDMAQWKDVFINRFEKYNHTKGISLYIHLPFCQSLCTYCGCNKKITTNHSVEQEYISALLKEWSLYRSLMQETPVIRELHIGGGTPTFFSPENLGRLLSTILSGCSFIDYDFSIEGHPNNTTQAHLKVLYNLGFRRISYGVQDNDPDVQRIINRIQPLENVQRATDTARNVGFTSVNFDLIYGLPLQNMQRMQRTLQQSVDMRPDRVAFYSYAHVPWTSRGQRLFDEHDLPSPAEKMNLYLLGKQMFTAAGYADIGMDHFSMPHDDLYKAWQQNRLHRNFMGYTTRHSAVLLGLGVSAISDTGNAFAQNTKTLHDYYHIVNSGILPVQKGFFLSDEDMAFRKYILDISCQGKATFAPAHLPTLQERSFPQLEQLRSDGLISFNNAGIRVTTLGRNFIRNICSAFDLYLLRSNPNAAAIFSKAI